MIYPFSISFVWVLALMVAILTERGRIGWFCGVGTFLIFLGGGIASAVAWLIYLLWRLLS